jgi:glycosyltransferase involved in cell wall biosynthesis
MKHKISIFIITYNEAHIISKCLEKLQTFDEIIVVDSGSTDATVSICESFGAKVI